MDEQKFELFIKALKDNNFNLEELVNPNALISIDMDDIKAISKGNLVATISQEINDEDEKLIINYINKEMPTDCVIKFIIKGDVGLKTIDKIIGKLKLINPKMSFVYGTEINENMYTRIKILAILTN